MMFAAPWQGPPIDGVRFFGFAVGSKIDPRHVNSSLFIPTSLSIRVESDRWRPPISGVPTINFRRLGRRTDDRPRDGPYPTREDAEWRARRPREIADEASLVSPDGQND